MVIKRINEFPEGSGSLSSDDIFLFMDDPSGSGITKKISLSQISSSIGGGGGGGGITLEEVQDNLGTSFLVGGSGIAYSYSDAGGTLTANILHAPKIITNVFNNTGSQIPKFSAVYINGGQGDQPTVSLAIATGDATSAATYGVTAQAINHMSTGDVVVFGSLTGINTDQFNPTAPTGDVNGTILYLSPTASGGITKVKPSAPNHIVKIGTIVRTHLNAGIVEVNIQNGFELEELHNVAISGVTGGAFLQYNSASGLWLASNSGNFTTLLVNGTGVSVNGHTHTSSNITDFTESVQDVIGANGFLIGQSGITISYNDNSNTLTITGSGSSGTTITNASDNRILTSTGTSTGINAESNFTFNGTNLVVTGDATVDNLKLDANTISSTNSNGNIIFSPNGSGKVGLGTNSPSYLLDVNGTGKFIQLCPTIASIGNVTGSVGTDASTAQIFDMTLTGNITLSNPTNAIDGLTLRWRITQNGTGGHGVTLDTSFAIPDSASNPLPWSTAANKTDILAATYHAGRDKWDIVAFVPGY